MTALLPPDPTREAHYWLRGPNGHEVSAKYRWACWRVEGDNAYCGALFMAERGYTLASRHPIPTAAQLDALHNLARWVAENVVDDEWDKGHVEGCNYILTLLRAALKGDAP